jgi:hypothetical protein
LLLALACGPAPDGESGTSGATEGPTTRGSETGTDTSTVGTAGSTTDDTTGTMGTMGTTGEPTGTTGDPSGPPLPTACALARVDGDVRLPLELDFVGGTSLRTLDPGDPDSDAPARVLAARLETKGSEHGEIRARAFTLGAVFPDDVQAASSALAMTKSGHTSSRMVELPGGGARFGFLWTGDPRGTNKYDTFYSVLDADAWSVGGTVEVISGSNPDFVDLLQVPSGAELLATYTADPFGETPHDFASGLSLGVLDASGDPLVAATPLTETAAYPGAGARTFWAGDRVAAAIAHNDCDEVDPLCSPHAIVLAQPTAPDPHGAAADGYAPTHVIAGLETSAYVSRPRVEPRFGLNWLLWYEGEGWTASGAHRTLRAQVLDETGTPIPWPPGALTTAPIDYLVDQVQDAWPTVLISEFGVTAVQRTIHLDPVELDSVPTFEVHHFDFNFEPLGEPIYLALDSFESFYPAMTALAHPRGLLLAWDEATDDAHELRMTLLACTD